MNIHLPLEVELTIGYLAAFSIIINWVGLLAGMATSLKASFHVSFEMGPKVSTKMVSMFFIVFAWFMLILGALILVIPIVAIIWAVAIHECDLKTAIYGCLYNTGLYAFIVVMPSWGSIRLWQSQDCRMGTKRKNA
jgi:hypothetical protein